MTEPYIDRWGKEHIPDETGNVYDCAGAFGVLTLNDSVLLATSGIMSHIWDLPGGEIDPGETPEQAMIRETYEETGLALPEVTPLKSHTELIRVWGEISGDFLNYTHHFFLIDLSPHPDLFFEGIRAVETGWDDAEKTSWIKISDLADTPLNHNQRPVIEEFLT